MASASVIGAANDAANDAALEALPHRRIVYVSDLSKVPFLAQLSAADLDDLAQRLERRTYEAGDLIYAEGTPGDGLYYLESGSAVVLTGASCDGEIMAHLPAGSTFGETALISDRPRSVRRASRRRLHGDAPPQDGLPGLPG